MANNKSNIILHSPHKKNSSVFDIIKQPNKDIIKAYSNNDWVAKRKSVSPMDIIKSLNDVLCGSNEFNISLFHDVRYADGTKGNMVDKYKCVIPDGEIFTVNKKEVTDICFPFKIKAKIKELNN